MEFKKKKILMVDDSQLFLMYAGILLKRFGFNVIPAENGVEALKLLKIIEPDIIMLDVRMKMLDGITILKHLKADTKTSTIPVIMVSVDSNSETIEECKKLGCSGYLIKPLKIDKLHEVLEESIFSPMGTKREHLRAPFPKKVMVTFDGIPYELYAETLSEGGIFIRKKDSFPLGSEVEVTFHLKGGEPIYLKGVVIYIKELFGNMLKLPPGMAIKFREVTPDQSKLLKNFIEHLIAHDLFDGQEEPVIEIEKDEI